MIGRWIDAHDAVMLYVAEIEIVGIVKNHPVGGALVAEVFHLIAECCGGHAPVAQVFGADAIELIVRCRLII